MIRTNAVTVDTVTGEKGTFSARNMKELLRFMESENVNEVDAEFYLYGQAAYQARLSLDDVRAIVNSPTGLDS